MYIYIYYILCVYYIYLDLQKDTFFYACLMHRISPVNWGVNAATHCVSPTEGGSRSILKFIYVPGPHPLFALLVLWIWLLGCASHLRSVVDNPYRTHIYNDIYIYKWGDSIDNWGCSSPIYKRGHSDPQVFESLWHFKSVHPLPGLVNC
jgi:hypothetical protein